jgi:hypothetical protein
VQRLEQTIQQAVFDHLRFRGKPGIVFWHTPNGAFLGGKRNRRGASIQGAIMKKNGVRAGVSDVLIFHDAKLFALELKSPKGRPSEAQLEFIADVEAAGGFTCIAEGVDEAVKALESWQLLRGRAA